MATLRKRDNLVTASDQAAGVESHSDQLLFAREAVNGLSQAEKLWLIRYLADRCEEQMTTAEAEYITISEAVERFGVSRDRLRKWVQRKTVHLQGRDANDGRGLVLLDPDEVATAVARIGVERRGRPPKS